MQLHTSVPSRWPRRFRLLIGVVASLVLSNLLVTCSQPVSLFALIQERGQLVVIARPQAGTLIDQNSQARKSLEETLVERFAAELGVEIVWRYEANANRLLAKVAAGEAHMGVGDLAMTQRRDAKLAFGPTILQRHPQLIYARDHSDAPSNLTDLPEKSLVMPEGSGYIDVLEQIQTDLPTLSWQVQLLTEEELLKAVAAGSISFTVADVDVLAQMKRYYPNLRSAFDVGPVIPTAWAFPQDNSRNLQAKAVDFFQGLLSTNELNRLQDDYFGHLDRHNESDLTRFNRLRAERLPKYWSLFTEAAEQNQFDPALLAAVAYQESFWNPVARSPTGVRGMMMLTQATASDLNVQDRTDAKQSIMGGAAYLAQLREHFNERAAEPDATWFALAAYNVGSGHVRDAMKLARDLGLDGDRWVVVREYLNRLRDPEWHKLTYYGYARGDEAVGYVENIRSYQDLLQGFAQQKLAGEPAVDDPTWHWYLPELPASESWW